jgi:alpha-amylase
MKKLLLFIIILTSFNAFAKKVKFAVDMSGYEIFPTGIHVAGDFQKALGLPKNWLYDATKLTKEKSDTNVYSIVVDLPAFKKYEYKFVNGDQDYQVEFIPDESRVGYNFVANRWIYVDSLANDTTFVGAIRFEQNSPKGLELLRLKVDMSKTAADKKGIHLFGSFQNWNPQQTIMYSFEKNIYDVIVYVKKGSYEYKFVNGNVNTAAEIVPTACAKNQNRAVKVDTAIVVTEVCFAECAKCAKVSTNDVVVTNDLEISPNPAKNGFWLKNILPKSKIEIFDLQGQIIASYTNDDEMYYIDNQTFIKGFYLIKVKNNNLVKTGKVIVE